MKDKKPKSKKPLTITEFSRLGNQARNVALSPERRKAIAQKAIAARWKKYRAEQKE